MKTSTFDVVVKIGSLFQSVGNWTDNMPCDDADSYALRKARAEMDRYKSSERALRRLVDGQPVEVLEHKQAE